MIFIYETLCTFQVDPIIFKMDHSPCLMVPSRQSPTNFKMEYSPCFIKHHEQTSVAPSIRMCGSHAGNPCRPAWHLSTCSYGCPSWLHRSFPTPPHRLVVTSMNINYPVVRLYRSILYTWIKCEG